TSDSSAADRVATPSATDTSMPSGLSIDRAPFGPLTAMLVGWMFSSTPLPRAIGFLATLDIAVAPLCHEAQDFAADDQWLHQCVGHDALGGGDDGNAEAAQDLRQRVLAAVLPQARARNAEQALDHRVALEVLQHALELGLGAVLDHA